jgi:hypothetical protein
VAYVTRYQWCHMVSNLRRWRQARQLRGAAWCLRLGRDLRGLAALVTRQEIVPCPFSGESCGDSWNKHRHILFGIRALGGPHTTHWNLMVVLYETGTPLAIRLLKVKTTHLALGSVVADRSPAKAGVAFIVAGVS